MAKSGYETIAEITSAQWGLITTAQAARASVGRLKLSRLAERSLLVRILHGVYRDAGAPVSNYEMVKALWLSTNPSVLAEERLVNPDVIVGGTTATALWGYGDLELYPCQFYTVRRKQTQRSELTFIKSDYSQSDFVLIDGLPVARIEYVMPDLEKRGYDRAHLDDIHREVESYA